MKEYFVPLFLIACLFPLLADSSPIPVDGTAAVVNETVITISEVLITMQPVQRLLMRQHSGEELARELEAAYERTLDSLVERQLILDEYKRQKKFVVPDNVIDMQLDEILHTRFDGDRAKLMKTLDSDGITMKEWREEIKNRMIISLMRNMAVGDTTEISPQAVREAYQASIDKYRTPAKVELRMIVIHRGTTEQEVSAKRKQADDIRQKIIAGEDFAALAREVSQGTKADEGGYWGWVDPETRRSELAEALVSLNPGEISEVIEAGDSFYILKVHARKHASVVPFEDARETIQAELSRKQSQEAYNAWIRRLKDRAYVRIF